MPPENRDAAYRQDQEPFSSLLNPAIVRLGDTSTALVAKLDETPVRDREPHSRVERLGKASHVKFRLEIARWWTAEGDVRRLSDRRMASSTASSSLPTSSARKRNTK